MNRIKALLVSFLCLIAISAQATITRVQSTSGNTGASTATSLAITFGAAPSDGDGKYHYLIVVVGCSSALSPWANIDANYSWQVFNFFGSNGSTATIFWAKVLGTGSTSVTFNTFTASAISAIGAEYKSDAPLRFDQQAGNTGSSTSPSTATTGTTKNANELAIAAYSHRLQSASTTGTYVTPTNSFAEIVAGGKSTNINTANSDREVDLLEKFLTSTGTATTGITVTGANNWCGDIITFEEFSSSGSGFRIPSIGTN